MFELVSMWKKPQMVAYAVFIALLYPAVMYPFLQYSFFGANADYLRVGVAIPAAFSFLFGPAAAFGAAFGNVIYDVFTNSLNAASYFGFIGNFLIAYIPYKLWKALTTQKPDMRSAKKVLLFMGLAALSCSICGLVIGWGLFYLYGTFCPFVMTTATIFASDALWAVLLGPVILVLSYGFFSRRKLLYTDIMFIRSNSRWNKARSLAIFIFVISTLSCFVVAAFFTVNVWLLLPFVVLSLAATVFAGK